MAVNLGTCIEPIVSQPNYGAPWGVNVFLVRTPRFAPIAIKSISSQATTNRLVSPFPRLLAGRFCSLESG